MVAGRGFAAREVARKHSSHVQRDALRGLAGALLLCSGCAPVAFAVKQRAAERAVAAAEAADAQAHAIYEIVLARRYLDKAREESAEAHYAWALELLAKSEHNAVRARTLSADLQARERLPGSTSDRAAEPSAEHVQGNLR